MVEVESNTSIINDLSVNDLVSWVHLKKNLAEYIYIYIYIFVIVSSTKTFEKPLNINHSRRKWTLNSCSLIIIVLTGNKTYKS